MKGDAQYSSEHEDETILMRGLFLTSFLAEDSLSDSDLFGAKSIVISSASSKTSIALSFVVAGQSNPGRHGRRHLLPSGVGTHSVSREHAAGSLPQVCPASALPLPKQYARPCPTY